MRSVTIQPMDEDAFRPFGDLIDFERDFDFHINEGNCERFHVLGKVEATGDDGFPAISLGRAQPYPLPLELKLMERHPLGSQAWIPLSETPFLVVVAPDDGGKPGQPLAFMTLPGQGVNYHRNVWHAVITPVEGVCKFVIVDRAGEGNNLEEHFFDNPWLVIKPNTRTD